MERREFVSVLCGVIMCPLTAWAQKSQSVRRIGVLLPYEDERDPRAAAIWLPLKQRLRELGWTENGNIRFELRLTGEDAENIRAGTKELVRAAPEVIIAFVLLRRDFWLPPEVDQYLKSITHQPGTGSTIGLTLAARKTIHIHDVLADPDYKMPDVARRAGLRTSLGVPLLREGTPIGVFALGRKDVRSFTDAQIGQVSTFADQAVIAIENVRLLEELRGKTDQLQAQSEELAALNQQLEQRVSDQVGEIERMGRLRRFLPPQVADLIVASGNEKQLESHRREITALFCDLRGFTGFSESSDPEDVMALLAEYHAAIGEIIFKYSGTLERYGELLSKH
jgi:GAF domain-containing protein